MSSQTDPAELMQQWLQLTREESAAIQSALWPEVRRIQARKAALRESLTAAARQPGQKDGTVRHTLKPFSAEAGRISSLLTRSSETLAAELRRLQFRQESLDQARRNLRKIQRSYFQPQQPPARHFYG